MNIYIYIYTYTYIDNPFGVLSRQACGCEVRH